MIILVCAFKANSPRSLSYRKYTTKQGATKAIIKIFLDGKADYISVRIVKEEKCPSQTTARNAQLPDFS